MTPSVALSVSGDGATPTPSGDGRSIVAARTAPALNHRIRRGIAAVDLAPWPELRITLNADVATGARPDSPFFLELRLGSAAAPIGAAGNDWHRRLPIERAGAWETARLSLADLPAPVRAATTQIELRCVSDTPFTARIDQLVASRPSFPSDIDDALLALLDQRISIGGTPVSAQVMSAGGALPGALPLILIQPYDLRPASQRDAVDGGPSDFTAGGAMRLRGASDPFELDYAIEARAATRAEQAAIVDFLIGALPRQGPLAVNGTILHAEWRTPPDGLHSFPIERQLIHLRVTAWRERSAPVVIRPVKSVSTIIDSRETADG
ncbi:hypothetical protein DBR17_01550 [Sphingomonas sp. HMWF008]|nr:hypothetical protein DBR17_01550 [Sphingomonas sp. HMWF008]